MSTTNRVLDLAPAAAAFCLTLWLAAAGSATPGPRPETQETGREELGASRESEDANALARLDTILAKLRHNQQEQRAAWPTRETDQLAERSPPPAFERVIQRRQHLESERQRVLVQVEREAHRDTATLLRALAGSKTPDVAEALAPIVAKASKGDALAVEVLETVAKRLDPCPPAVVKALEEIGGRRGNAVLLREGAKRQDLALLIAAGRQGDPTAIGALVDSAEDLSNPSQAKLCTRALERLTPPARPHPDLGKLVVLRITKARSPQLKAVMIGYLGLMKNPKHESFLRKLYATDDEPRIRLAVLAAMGRLGGATVGELALAQLRQSETDLAVRRGCIHALGSAKHRPAIEDLIALLDDPALRADAARALSRISGQRLGERTSAWTRWWRTQPEGRGAAPDPEG